MRKIEIKFKFPDPQYQIGTVFKDNLILDEEIEDNFKPLRVDDSIKWQLDESKLDEDEKEELLEVRADYSDCKVRIVGYEFVFPLANRSSNISEIIVNHFFDNGIDDDIAVIDLTKHGKYIYLMEAIEHGNSFRDEYYEKRHKIPENELTELIASNNFEYIVNSPNEFQSLPPENLPLGSTHMGGWDRISSDGSEVMSEYQIITGYRTDNGNFKHHERRETIRTLSLSETSNIPNINYIKYLEYIKYLQSFDNFIRDTNKIDFIPSIDELEFTFTTKKQPDRILLVPLINTIFTNGDVYIPLIDLVLDENRKSEYAGDRFEYSLELEYHDRHDDTNEIVHECKLFIEISSTDLDNIDNELLADDYDTYFVGKGIQAIEIDKL